MSERAERVKKIVLLLGHRLDYLDSAQRLAQSFPSKPGAVPTEKVACGCGRLVSVEGRMEWRGDHACMLCSGSGFRLRIVRLDGDDQQDDRGAIYDPYTYAHDRSSKAGQGGLRVMERWEVDRELARLRADKRARAGVHLKTDAYGWEKARERRDKSGSFKELDRALDALSIRYPGLAVLVYNVFKGIYGQVRDDEPPRTPVGAGTALWQALLFIEERMPEPIRVPQHLTDTAKDKERKEGVPETYKRTLSITKTARSHGLRKHRVKAMLREAGLIQ